jgi:anaerobic selenocysteine-containing dehydrogenase
MTRKVISEYITACPRNCYSTCSMKVQVETGRLRRIEALPTNQATPEGVCLKGLSYVERVHSPARILDPLKKMSGSDKFEKISWDEALDHIVSKIVYFKENFGPQSIFYYAASGTKGLLNAVGANFWRLVGGYTTTYGDLCWPAGLEATRLTLGENKHNVPWDIANAKLIILWGKNSAETNIHQMVFIENAIESGGKLIVIDPRRTQSSEQAELLIQPRPGTDGALALAIGHILINEGFVDRSFINEYVLGFEEYRKMVLEFTPEKAAEITDIPVKHIYRIAEYIGTIKPLTINTGYGMQRYTNSGQTIRAILALQAITGNIGKPGAGWIYANLQSHIFDKVADPIAFYPPEKPDGIARISISTAKLGSDMLGTTNPPLKMIWVERGNPVTQNPETNTVLKAFRSLDFRVVVEQFFTDTAREADIILPAKTMFEQSDVVGAYWHPYIQLKQKVIEPPGGVKPESEIYYLLAKRMDFTDNQIDGKIPGTSDKEIEEFLTKKLEPFPEITLLRLRDGPVLAPGNQEIAFSDLNFKTPSGKIELVSAEAKKRWGVPIIPDFNEPMESVKRKSAQSKKYPLYLMTPNTKNRIHSQFNNLEMIRKLSPKPQVSVNPEDAKKRGVDNNSLVKIYNDRGSLTLEAKFDFGIKPGCISITNGWWISEGGTVNFCSLGRETDMGYGAAFHDNLVEIKRI